MAGKKTAFRSKFEKFKKKSDELYLHFKDMRSKLGALAKEASALSEQVNLYDAEPDPGLMILLLDYSTFIGTSVEDIYATLFNMKNSTYTKVVSGDKRKPVCYERDN